MAEGCQASSEHSEKLTGGEEPEGSISTLICAVSRAPSQLSYLERSSAWGYRGETGRSKIPVFIWHSSTT